MITEKISVTPDICSYFIDNETKLCIDIALPGVKKENINIKMLKSNLFLTAPRDDIKYVSSLSMCCDVVPEKAEAKYENGLLKIIAPFEDVMEGAVEVKVQ
jgi:HSP20 family molecular chaperone IbpA